MDELFLLPLNGNAHLLRSKGIAFYNMITAKDITKSFGDLQVLKGISLEIGKGEVVSIVGASGAGKSTLLQILGTLSQPDGGSLEIDGFDVLSMRGDRI